MTEVNDWAPLAADNVAAPPDGAPESVTKVKDVNNIIREMMAKLRRELSDSDGVAATLSGVALTINGARTIAAYYNGLSVTAVPDQANPGPISARYNSLAYKAVLKNGAALAAGDLPANQPARLTFWADAWHLMSCAATTVTQAALASTVSGLRAEMRIPVGGIFITAATTDNPNAILGYGTWTQVTGGIISAGTYADGQGFGVNHPLGTYVGKNYLNPALYANAVPPHAHGIADHDHGIGHGHQQTGHGHYETPHAHGMDHAHRVPDGTVIEVPFGTASGRRLKLTNDVNDTVTFLPVSSIGAVYTYGSSTTFTGQNAASVTGAQVANIGATTPAVSAPRALTTQANVPVGLVDNIPWSLACMIWRRTA